MRERISIFKFEEKIVLNFLGINTQIRSYFDLKIVIHFSIDQI